MTKWWIHQQYINIIRLPNEVLVTVILIDLNCRKLVEENGANVLNRLIFINWI